MSEAELVAVKDIDPRMSELDDWQLLHALHHHPRPWDGLVTTDVGIARLPRELAVLEQTKLSLVIADASGHDPIRATGLVLARLGNVCNRTAEDHAQIWFLRAAERKPDSPRLHLDAISKYHGLSAGELFDQARLSRAEFARNPLNAEG